jgi:hypothetical protein
VSLLGEATLCLENYINLACGIFGGWKLMVTSLLWLLTSLLPDPCSSLPSLLIKLDLVVGMGDESLEVAIHRFYR